MTKSIDKWAAVCCGIHVFNGFDNKLYDADDNEWTIKDPRCRERFFAHLLNDGYCVFMEKDSRGVCIEISKRGSEPDTHAYLKDTCGESLNDSGIACITAIYEAENGSEE